MLESEAAPSGIAGYGKGKAPEKHICTNCLRKGIEYEWDEGGQGKSDDFLFLTLLKSVDRQVLPAVSEAKDLMCTRRIGALVVKEGLH